MKKIFIEYPKCSTCRKAKKWLEENGIESQDRNIVIETPTVQELEEWIKRSKKDIKKWFNTSGLKYRELKLKDKLENMSDKEKIELLASDGMLIKRPILISDRGVNVGFNEEEWKKNIK
jgi:arsenate reductase